MVHFIFSVIFYSIGACLVYLNVGALAGMISVLTHLNLYFRDDFRWNDIWFTVCIFAVFWPVAIIGRLSDKIKVK